MKKILLSLFLSLLFANDNIYSKSIQSIVINGNNRTKEHIIKREVMHPIDAPLDSLILNQDLNRLYNLGIFSTVDIYVEDQIYYVDLVESFSILPLPIFEFDETNNQWTVGAAVGDINFLGLNQKLFLQGTFLGDKMYVMSLYNPWLFGDHISLKFDMFNIYSENVFYDFFHYNTGYMIESGFYRGLKNKFKLKFGFYKNLIQEASLSYNLSDFLSDTNLEHKYYLFNSNYQFDSRDIYIDPTKGSFFQLDFRYYKGLDVDNFYTISALFKQYFSFKNTYSIFDNPVFSYKIYTLLKYPDYEKLPFFEYEYLGGEDYVRGYSSHPDKTLNETEHLIENSNIIYGSLELQSTLLERKDYGSRYRLGQGIEFGIDGFLFIDAGVGSKVYNNFIFENILVGYGFGLKFFILGGPPVSLSFGFNPYGTFEYHLSD